ncbi:MAG: polyribonucleotide nucleotidyltransferase, partial [Deltaproteobacteria bacterium]|nr:polyribonucleotide nucleotidyltransferase [Deltaproteobacteria bacterium]
RPLFPDGYANETNIVANVLSVDSNNAPDAVALSATSIALTISDIPFGGPLAACRVCRVNGEFICNPSSEQIALGDINIFLAGKKGASQGSTYAVDLVMLEGDANEKQEEDLVLAIQYGLEQLRPLIDLQEEMRSAIGNAKRAFEVPSNNEALEKALKIALEADLKGAYGISRKQERYARLGELKKKAREIAVNEALGTDKEASRIFAELDYRALRDKIIREKKRIDGRPYDGIRPISIEVGLLPRVHGSALFTRGETQALAALTLGTSADEQRLDYITGEETRTFMLHYNFPPYCVGEARPLRSPGRREIGHGNLARRALVPLVPTTDEFPYTIRIVSEILSSNGSSSMATVCAASLALMDGGVPVKNMVAGIAMGLLKEGEEIVILSDILGDEDHTGDMDFKVCGTLNGVTAMQMDIKIDGITEEVLIKALNQAKAGREHIIGKMEHALANPRTELSMFAPRITTIKIKPEKVREVIGAGGKTIRQIVSDTGVTINVEDDGTIKIASADAAASQRAVDIIKGIVEEPELGKIYQGKVKRIVDFGAFVEIIPGTEGLVHISQLAKERVQSVSDVVKEGEIIPVKVIEIDEKQGRIRLSRKEAME